MSFFTVLHMGCNALAVTPDIIAGNSSTDSAHAALMKRMEELEEAEAQEAEQAARACPEQAPATVHQQKRGTTFTGAGRSHSILLAVTAMPAAGSQGPHAAICRCLTWQATFRPWIPRQATFQGTAAA